MTNNKKVVNESELVSPNNSDSLKRTLGARHLNMIAIGGSIGTGLFLASGATIAQSGPAGALIAFSVIGLMVYFLMTSLGELAAVMPVSGSFSTYANLYVDSSFGFALGWNYWYSWAVTIAVDLVASQIIMAYWFPGVPGVIWSAIFLMVLFALNMASVRVFGEAEYWFSLIKIVTIICFICLSVGMLLGILEGGEGGGFQLWLVEDGPISGGITALLGVAMIVGFSFQGTEFVGIAAGEAKDPAKTVPKAVKQVFWRVLLFYVLTIFLIGLLIPYTDPSLLRDGLADTSISPFTLIFSKAHLLSAAAVMNAVILTSVLSAGNSGMYASSRMLYSLAKEGRAPALFSRVNRSGTPVWALLATAAIAGLCFLTFLFSPGKIYIWLLNTAGMMGFIAWLGIAVSHYRFRRGYLYQGRDIRDLPYVSKFFPYGSFFALMVCAFVMLGQNYQAFMGEQVDWEGALATYIGLIIFLAFWLGHKMYRKTSLITYDEMKFAFADAPEEAEKMPVVSDGAWPDPVPQN